MERNSIAIYKYNKKYKIHGYSKTTAGMHIAAPPYLELLISDASTKLAATIELAFQAANSQVDHPTDWTSFTKEYLKGMVVRSNREIFMKYQYCELEYFRSLLSIKPSEYSATSKSFTILSEKAIELTSGGGSAVLAAAIEKAFSLCQ